jgi:hypothetical protein
MKNKILMGMAALSFLPIQSSANDAAYPSQNVAQFVVNTLDVTSLPADFRPKKAKGKKTFADYGFSSQNVGELNANLTLPGDTGTSGKKLTLNVLEEKPSGIYVCISQTGEPGAGPNLQAVFLLKRKNSNALLKGTSTSREFSACPAIGGDNSVPSSY